MNLLEMQQGILIYESPRYGIEFAVYAEPSQECAAIDCHAEPQEDCKYCLGHQLEADLAITELELYMAKHPSTKGWWRNLDMTKKGREA